MSDIVKTSDEILAVATAVRNEGVCLPDYNIFGESNEDSKAENEFIADSLEKIADELENPDGDAELTLSEIEVFNTEFEDVVDDMKRWLQGEASELSDYAE